MSALVGYDSSDEDEVETAKAVGQDQQPVQVEDAASNLPEPLKTVPGQDDEPMQDSPATEHRSSAIPPPLPPPSDGSLPAPILGPAAPDADPGVSDPPSRPQSPYSAYRDLIQNLTLPTVPNFSIPPSPPGSPPPGVDAKVSQFLKLKAQGVHFNEKLASSSALKNPALLGKLVSSAGLGEDMQYASSLPTEIWNPTDMFPDWAHKEELEKARGMAEERRQKEAVGRTRDKMDFVPARTALGADSGLVQGERERDPKQRVMNGLKREGPQPAGFSQPTTRKSRFDEGPDG